MDSVPDAAASAAPTPARDGERSRERILDAAERLMSARGFASTGISAISRASGLPASSIYWHFESKQGLLEAVVERSASSFLEELGAQLTADAPAQTRLRAFVETVISRAGANTPVFLRLLILLALDHEHLEPSLFERLESIRERGISRLREVLCEIYQAQGVRDAERTADAAALFAITFCQGSFVMQRMGPERVDGASLARQLEEALLRFPQPAPPPEGRPR